MLTKTLQSIAILSLLSCAKAHFDNSQSVNPFEVDPQLFTLSGSVAKPYGLSEIRWNMDLAPQQGPTLPSRTQPIPPVPTTAQVEVGKSKNVDILLVLDTTKSMSGHLDVLAENLPDIISEFSDDADWRIRLVPSDPPSVSNHYNRPFLPLGDIKATYSPGSPEFPQGNELSQPFRTCRNINSNQTQWPLGNDDIFLFMGVGSDKGPNKEAIKHEKERFKEVLQNIAQAVRARGKHKKSEGINYIEAMFFNAKRALTCDLEYGESWLRYNSGLVVLFASEINNCEIDGECPNRPACRLSIDDASIRVFARAGLTNYTRKSAENPNLVSSLLQQPLPLTKKDIAWVRDFNTSFSDKVLHARVFGLLGMTPDPKNKDRWRFPFTYLGGKGTNSGIIPQSGGDKWDINKPPYVTFFKNMSDVIKPYFPNPIPLSWFHFKGQSTLIGTNVIPDETKPMKITLAGREYSNLRYDPTQKSVTIPGAIVDQLTVGSNPILEFSFTPKGTSEIVPIVDFDLQADPNKEINQRSIVVTVNDEKWVSPDWSYKDNEGKSTIKFNKVIPPGGVVSVSYSYNLNPLITLPENISSVVSVSINDDKLEKKNYSFTRPRKLVLNKAVLANVKKLEVVYDRDVSAQHGTKITWENPVTLNDLNINNDNEKCSQITPSTDGKIVTIVCRTDPTLSPRGTLWLKKQETLRLSDEHVKYFSRFPVTCRIDENDLKENEDWTVDLAKKTMTIDSPAVEKAGDTKILNCIFHTDQKKSSAS